MNTSLSLRSAQSLTVATPSTRTSAAFLRVAVLGGLALLGTVGTALAQTAPSVKAKADAQTLALTVENPTQQRVHIQVTCQAHHICLMNEANHKPSYGGKLNFAGVPAGQYAVLLRVGHERYRYTVDVQATPQASILVRELAPAGTSEVLASAAR